MTLNYDNTGAFKPTKPNAAVDQSPSTSQTPDTTPTHTTTSQNQNPTTIQTHDTASTTSQNLNPTDTSSNTIPLDNSRDFRSYSNPSLGISLKYPSDWSIGTVKSGVQIIKEKGATYVDMRLNNLKKSVSDLKQYVDDDFADRKKSRSGFKIIDAPSEATISGNMPAYKSSYSFVKTESPGKGTTEKLLRYWTLLSDKSYTIAYVSDLESFDKYQPSAEEIISSVQLGTNVQNFPKSQQVSSERQAPTNTLVRELNVEPAPTGQKVMTASISQSPATSNENIFTINIGAQDSNSQNPVTPKSLVVKSGTVVTWINNDNSAHRIASGSPEKGPTNVFYSEPFDGGKNFTLNTSIPGVYEFYDPIWTNIKGTLTVVGQTGGKTIESTTQLLGVNPSSGSNECEKEKRKEVVTSEAYLEGFSAGCAEGYKDGKAGMQCDAGEYYGASKVNPYNPDQYIISSGDWKLGYETGYLPGYNIGTSGDPGRYGCNTSTQTP